MYINLRILFISLVGTTLEYYDFALYAAFLPKIADHFFAEPYSDQLSLIAYTLSFIARPLGAMVFGFIGDKYGRKKALIWPLILMAIATSGIAIIPPYSEIGAISCFCIITFRLLQGFCLGAEYGGALVFALEHHSKKLGIVAGLFGSSVLAGSLLANILSYIFTLPVFPENYWRVPFLIGGAVGIIGIWARYNINESPEFIKQESNKFPLLVIVKQYPLSFIKAISTSGLNGLMGSFVFVYLNFYFVKTLNFNLNHSLLLIIYAHIIAFLIAPIAGLLSQKYSVTKLIKMTAIAIILSIIPCMYLLSKENIFFIIVAMTILSIATGICWGCGNLILYNLFPASVRCSGVSLSDSTGRILFSAPIPFLCNYLDNTIGYMAKGFAIMIIVGLILVAQHFIYDTHNSK